MEGSKSLTTQIERIDPHRELMKRGERDLTNETSESARSFFSNILPVLQKYHAAMRSMEVRFEIIDRELSMKRHRNPIHHVESRIKDPRGIYDKLERYGKPQNVANAERYIMDMAGVRVICSYVQDVYELRDMIMRHDDLVVVKEKDYIAHPKENGYRSLHMIVKIPVHFFQETTMVPVEVQIRTIAMDFWASLEHELKYKPVREVEGLDFQEELRYCSAVIRDVERRMQRLSEAIDCSG